MKCGKSVETAEEYCDDCRQGKHKYDRGIASFTYNDYLKDAIYDFKYHNVRHLAQYFAEKMVPRYKYEILRWDADALIPVPMYEKKKRERGYNQAELLADELGKALKIPVRNDILYRCRNTKPQKELSNKNRIKNVQNAFQIRQNVVKLKKVILVDDIYTTGITIDECAGVLRANGVEKIYYISLCIGTGI